MSFEELYEYIHTPLVLILCLLGCVGHILSIGVLHSSSNPTNILLLSMSGSQLALCVNFLYSTLFKYGSEDLCLRCLWSSYWWTLSLLISVNLSVLVHLVSTFHLVALSIVRHLSLKQLERIDSAVGWLTYQKATKCLIIIYTSAFFVCTPLYFQSEVVVADPPDNCASLIHPPLPDRTSHESVTPYNPHAAYRLAFSNNTLLQYLNFWLFGSICKVVPSAILGLMTFGILRSLKKIREMSARFKNVDRDRQHHRTTQIILAVMLMFIIVESPQGLIAVAQSFYQIPYLHTIGDFFEVLTLLNSCLIFALFCSMNSRLRSAFAENSRTLWSKIPFRDSKFITIGAGSVRKKWRSLVGADSPEKLVQLSNDQTSVKRLSSLDEKEHYVLKPDDPSTSADVDQDETVHV